MMTVKNQVQLITYADAMGGDLPRLGQMLHKHFSDIFRGGVHILPPFPSSADRGFAPMTYFEIDPSFGSWEDISRIGEHFDVIVDMMVNHISRQSAYFQDFVKKGRTSPYADLFITLEKIWPDGDPPPADVAKIFLRKPDHPFSDIVIEETGLVERVWTSFGTRDWSEQVDLDVQSGLTRRFFADILTFMSRQKVSMLRLDAIGYVIKKRGTSCFFVEPEIYEFMDWFLAVAHALGMELLPEVHAHYSINFRLAERGYWIYDFILPGLILHTLFSRSGQKIKKYLQVCPRKQVTMLDCHDGIPIQPDLDDILEIDEAQRVVQTCLERGANLNRILSAEHMRRADFDAHQINCTYYDALGKNDDAYLAARAIQFFAPGVPQVYYVGLLAGENDLAAVAQAGEGRAINRHNFSIEEVEAALQKPVVQRLMQLIRFRNTYPAFNGRFSVLDSDEDRLALAWEAGSLRCTLSVDLGSGRSTIEYIDEGGQARFYLP